MGKLLLHYRMPASFLLFFHHVTPPVRLATVLYTYQQAYTALSVSPLSLHLILISSFFIFLLATHVDDFSIIVNQKVKNKKQQ